MATQSNHSPLASPRLAIEEKALLTYRAMANSDDIVLVLERDDRLKTNDALIVATNAAFRRASGYSDDQILGHAVMEVLPDENHTEALMNAIRGPGSLRSELACRRVDGGIFMLGMHLMRAPERTPGKLCFIVLGRDISALLKARQTQESVQQLLAKVFGSVDVAVGIINPSGHLVMTNRHIERLLGYKPNEMIGRASLELVAPGSRDSIAERVRQQRVVGDDISYSTPLLRKDGTEVAVSITSVIATTSDQRQFRIITLRPEAIDTTAIRSESVGRIKLVGIDDVRAALGDRWPAVAERAMATAETVIKRLCGPQDSFSRADDTSFLMCFGALSDEEASFRAAMIGREIRNRLVGQGEPPDNAYVRSIAAVVRFPNKGQSGASLNAILLSGLDEQLDRLEREARQTLSEAVEGATYVLEPTYGRNAAQTVASQVLISNKLERKLLAALGALPPKESEVFDLEGLRLGLAVQHAIASMLHGDTTTVIVKISFEIFSKRARTERFFATCAKIDARVSRRLVILLSSLPAGLPRTRLQDCVNRFRPFCQGVGYQIEEIEALAQIDLSNSYNPVVALPAAACFAGMPAKLKELFHSLQSRRAHVLVTEVGSAKDAAALRSIGADMISMKQNEP
jgi:PAS domain S-box-containing protein